ncbi:MAG: HDOD domain-containing protein [Nitrospirae bacterium]|nr:HDOD domain-containing protein [Nitrospirota bacterium]
MGNILKSYVQKIKELPTLPVTAHEILHLTVDPLLSVDKLKHIVEKDPAIAAKILSVANSAFFGYPVRTTQLNDAIMRIGFNSVKSIAAGIAVLSFLDDGKKTADYKRLFNHSVSVGLTARFIANNLKLGMAEDILIDGLLHDLGYLVLLRSFPTIYQNILDSLENEKSLLKAEKGVLSCTHADVGFWLAEQWKLPGTILDANLYHHTPSLAKRNEKRLAIIHVADYIAAKNIFSPIEKDPDYPLDHVAFDILTISDSDLKDMEESISNIPLSDEIFNIQHNTKTKINEIH